MAHDDLRVVYHPVLGEKPMGEPVTFYFNGRPVQGREGEPIAMALWASGIKGLGASTVGGEPRGLYCGIGHCFECQVVVDGRRNVRSCLEPVKAGLRVQSMVKDGGVKEADGNA